MTLADLANFVCTSTGYIEGDDQAAVRVFLLARDRMIYDAALWKSALLMTVIALDPVNNPDHAEGIVALPEEFQRTVGVRTTENALRVNAIENYFRLDADKFAETGSPFEFTELQPVFATWRGISQVEIDCDGGENNLKVKIVWRDGGTLKTTDLILMQNGVVNILFLNPDGDRQIIVTGAGDPLANGSYQFSADLNGGYWNTFVNENGYTMLSTGGWWTINGQGQQLYSQSVGSNAWQGAGSVNPIGIPLAGTLPVPTVTFPDPVTVEIVALYKDLSNGPVRVGYGYSEGKLSLGVVASVDSDQIVSPSYPRLRLFGIPSVATHLRVLAKAKYAPLADDRQEQTIRNSENCLIAFARGDLLRRGGENGAANLAYQEAAALLVQLKDLEAMQAANNQRIIPDSGYGPDYGSGHYWASGF
jgi:hypothetical protein